MPENIPNNSLPSGENLVVDHGNTRTSKTLTHKCPQCGTEFAHRYTGINRFCSTACSNKARGFLPPATYTCETCGCEFTRIINRKYTYCSPQCRGIGIAKKNQTVRDATESLICACGCNQPLPRKRSYDYGTGRPQRFLPYHKARIRVDIPCAGCGNIFQLTPWEAKTRTYCSRECYRLHAPKQFGPRAEYVPYIDVKCPVCNTDYRIRQREKDTGRHKTCSRACAVVLFTRTHGLKERVCSQTQRKRFRTSRPQRCEKCGYDRIPGTLTIHHIDENRHNWADDNVLVLCWTCHMELHFIAKTGPYKQARHRTRKVIKENFLSANESTAEMLKEF